MDNHFLALKNEWDEHLAILHVFQVFIAKIADIFALLNARRGDQENHAKQHESGIQPGGGFEKYTPAQEQQRAIQGMADISIQADRHQSGGFLHSNQRRVASLWFLPADFAQQFHPLDD